MVSLKEQIRDTEERYHSHAEQRRERQENVDLLRHGWGGDWRKVDEPSRVLNRLIALDQREAASEALGSLAEPRQEAAVGRTDLRTLSLAAGEASLLERILAEDDLLSVHYLLKGALVSRAVGRVVIRRRGRVAGYGTGFMVSPELMMTNNHVLRDAADAGGASIQFNFFEAAPGRSTLAVEFRLQPDRLFHTNRSLDYSVVAVAPRAGDVPVTSRGYIPLVAASGKAVVGERVNIIQHPGGEPQQVAVHQNRIVDVVGSFLHYSTDTNRGSSGSPVLNDQWELAALHHSGVPKRSDDGRVLLLDGTPWSGSDRDRERIHWIANEGVRISRIVEDLGRRVAGNSEHTRLFDASLETCDFDLENLRLRQALEELAGRGPSSSGLGATTVTAEDGTATWVLPLTVRVALPGVQVGGGGGPAAGGGSGGGDAATPGTIPAAPPTAGDSDIDEDALATALARLEEHSDEPYYDEAADGEAREGYYPAELVDADGGLSAEERFQGLAQLLEETHEYRPGYRTARLEYLYPWIDLRPDRTLASIYSGQGFDPEEVIRLDLEIAAEREELLRERLEMESGADLEAVLADLETLLPYNCEHVVPQSWFGEAQPMKADLHHLFTCEAPCNSFRGNSPYFQFPVDPDEAYRDACGRSEEGRSKFEPVAGKGAVARATLYFLLRYPGIIGDEMRELQAERLGVLLGWHREFEVDEYERHRNAAVFEVQGNRNPFIDFPDLVDHLDLRQGFGIQGG